MKIICPNWGIYALLIGSFIIMLSASILTSNTLYVQFIHLLLPSSISAQSQPTLSSQPTSSSSSSPPSPPPSPPSSSVSSLPDVFQKVENSVVQITSTKSNP